jgi:hypothetical protein
MHKMSNLFIARNVLLYPSYSSDNSCELSDEILIPSYHYNKLIGSYSDNEPLLLKLTNTENDLDVIVSIGTPHRDDKNTIFVPKWILDLIGCREIGTNITIEKIDYDIPIAKKIVIKPFDPIAFEIDTLACFEKALMNLHTIKEGIILPIPVPDLGNDYIMYAYIERIEPSGLARIVNGEVDVEFINDFATPTEPSRNVQETIDESFDLPIPTDMFTINSTVISKPIGPDQEQQRIMREARLKRFGNNEG